MRDPKEHIEEMNKLLEKRNREIELDREREINPLSNYSTTQLKEELRRRKRNR
ncbi:MAG: hypothetical protein RBR71_03595 [Gudongella sp.]|nr:hypothetical protein [Gudongella sp.]